MRLLFVRFDRSHVSLFCRKWAARDAANPVSARGVHPWLDDMCKLPKTDRSFPTTWETVNHLPVGAQHLRVFPQTFI
jgi:hypothetical protein